MGMANQICRFNLQKKIFSTFDRRDGISHDLFNPAADYKMSDGRLVYLTDKNFIAFHPASVTATTVSGDVAINVSDSPSTQVLHNSIVISGTYPNAIEYRFPDAANILIANNLADRAIVSRDGASATLVNNSTSATMAQ